MTINASGATRAEVVESLRLKVEQHQRSLQAPVNAGATLAQYLAWWIDEELVDRVEDGTIVSTTREQYANKVKHQINPLLGHARRAGRLHQRPGPRPHPQPAPAQPQVLRPPRRPLRLRPSRTAAGTLAGVLHQLWGDDAESVAALQEVIGYLIARRHQPAEAVPGDRPETLGKGTIGRVVTALLGAHHVAGPTLAGLETNFGLSALIGRPVALIADARLRAGQDVVTERLLSISGEDTLTADRKYREPWTGRLPTRVVILSNELPRLPDSSGALASRFVILTMTRSCYGRENPALTGELLGELPAIFNCALDGLERLRDRGQFLTPAASRTAVEELEDLGSPIAAFLRDRCTVATGHRVKADVLYAAWRGWCDEQGRDHPGIVQTFGRDLRAATPASPPHRPTSPASASATTKASASPNPQRCSTRSTACAARSCTRWNACGATVAQPELRIARSHGAELAHPTSISRRASVRGVGHITLPSTLAATCGFGGQHSAPGASPRPRRRG